MIVAARLATPGDVATLIDLYGPARDEQAALREAWPIADGLAEPIDEAFTTILDDDESFWSSALSMTSSLDSSGPRSRICCHRPQVNGSGLSGSCTSMSRHVWWPSARQC